MGRGGEPSPRTGHRGGLGIYLPGEALDVVSPHRPISFLRRFPVSLTAPKSEPRSLWAGGWRGTSAPGGGQALRPGISELSLEHVAVIKSKETYRDRWGWGMSSTQEPV